MSGNRRLQKELQDLHGAIEDGTITYLRNLDVNESDFFHWKITLLPTNVPYKNGAFKVEISFTVDYPFKPPTVKFLTKIYHPNIDEKGQVCLPIINSENWKPTTKVDQVLQSLAALVNDPEPDHALRNDIAEEFSKDRSKFNKNAEKFTKEYAEKR